jgi:hypothetical protein
MDSCDDTLAGGLPHSDIHGSKPARGSPWLFAACHVLHRLLVPRHPPNALIILRSSGQTQSSAPVTRHRRHRRVTGEEPETRMSRTTDDHRRRPGRSTSHETVAARRRGVSPVVAPDRSVWISIISAQNPDRHPFLEENERHPDQFTQRL